MYRTDELLGYFETNVVKVWLNDKINEYVSFTYMKLIMLVTLESNPTILI